jgi:hypothetical protein
VEFEVEEKRNEKQIIVGEISSDRFCPLTDKQCADCGQ